jgi:cyclopropane fatty-acyl-phospholipid synthase-like methyltransferase
VIVSEENRLSQEELQAAFDEWAQTYDQDLQGALPDHFPFAGYAQALESIWQKAGAAAGDSVLDLGVGTGNLARLFLGSGCRVQGADFSSAMLAKTAAKFPELALAQVDLTADEWPAPLEQRFDHIVSNYVFHEFPLPVKLRILERLAAKHLAAGSSIVIGDISFPTTADLNRVKTEQSDEWEEEFYWVEVEARAALEAAGWTVDYEQLSFCAGVYVLSRG